MKVPQLLQHFEHLVSPLAAAISTWTQEYGVKSIVSEVVRLAPTHTVEPLSGRLNLEMLLKIETLYSKFSP